MKVLISKKSGKYYYPKETQDYHCKEGIIKQEDLNSDKKVVVSTKNKEFFNFTANNFDYRQKIKRGPQIITPKDLGYIIARTAMNKNSVVVEAGGGSGAATSFFAGIVNKVHTFEVIEDNYKIIQKNLDFLGCNDNVNLTNGDLKENISQLKDYDLLFLDMPNCHEVLNEDISGLKSGHYIVCYIPSISQIQALSDLVFNREDLYLEEVTEVGLRHWKVEGKVSRPEHQKEIDHTAFLVFIRKN